MKNDWFKGLVLKGNRLGRTTGFPTVNLDPAILKSDVKQGAYAAWVKFEEKICKAMMYFGPRLVLGETKDILEINIFDFSQEIYGREIEFQVWNFLHEPMDFGGSFERMKEQLERDVIEAKRLLES